ncbi:putative RDD family membrane protein YckC [Kribbella voronezhensis]|uniref:Putative RDD family membrane protein YckC n=1 Tax=Kribbella voronezhensis TaxID=2512212 RepID=A0A4R7TAF7_9ACTN|nr:RDD family protein [Kribbella voronezhensis]TDU88981.1 putative RDD family membrane protein YckC [Kribbella voronezhensis]
MSYPGQPAHPGQPGGYPPGQPGQFPPGQPGGNQGLQPYSPVQPGYNPYHQGGYGFAPLGGGQLAGWGSRVGASILDSLIALVPIPIGVVTAVAISGSMEQMTDSGRTAMAVGYLAYFVLVIWNRIIRQGRTGQSLGKKMLGLKLVAKSTGRPLGVGRCLGREVCGIVLANLCFLDLLWPLWDQQHQTWHDKIVASIVVKQ